MTAPSAADRPLVVIVDDDRALLNALQLRFELEGLAVAAFTTAEQALAASLEAACYVIDLRLPGMNGLQYLSEVRRRGQSAPAILITSQPLHLARAQAAAMGTPIFEKPLLDDRLAMTVRNLAMA
jgi:FixJ family two-component response regulator